MEDGEPNKGRLCVKGRYGFDFIYSEDRLKTPLIKENGGFREASWDESLDLVANKFKEIISQSGPDAIAGVSCARSINEDSYQMQKLFSCGDRNEQYRSLRPYLTCPNGCRAGSHVRFRGHDQFV